MANNKATTNITKAVSGSPYRDNGATVLYGGNIDSSSTVTNAPDASIVGHHSGKHGSVVPGPTTQGDHPNLAVQQPLAGGEFAKMRAGIYVVRKLTGQNLAGVSNTVLESGASNFGRRSIHLNEQQVTLLQITAGWNYVTGAFLSTPSTQTDSFGNDDAARPTRAVPGELQYTAHSPAVSGQGTDTIELDDYKENKMLRDAVKKIDNKQEPSICILVIKYNKENASAR